MVAKLRFPLLKQHHSGSSRDVDATHSVEALGLTDELQNLPVKVHVEAHVVLRVLDNEHGHQA